MRRELFRSLSRNKFLISMAKAKCKWLGYHLRRKKKPNSNCNNINM